MMHVLAVELPVLLLRQDLAGTHDMGQLSGQLGGVVRRPGRGAHRCGLPSCRLSAEIVVESGRRHNRGHGADHEASCSE